MAVDFYDLYCEMVTENEILKKAIKEFKKRETYVKSLESHIKILEKENQELRENLDELVEQKIEKAVQSAVDKVTEVFKKEIEVRDLKIAHYESLMNMNSTTSGIPTSKTPINQNKHIPNSRTKFGKKKGGQAGHKKHVLAPFNDDEVTEVVDHKINKCSECHATLEHVVYTTKDELDYDVVIKKKRHVFHEATCPNCGKKERVKIPSQLKEANQYGTKVQAMALSLMNEGYVSIKRTSETIYGMSNGEIKLSEGYISKLNKRLAKELEEFIKELKKEAINLDVLYWDDTVIFISTNRACLRFYGDERYALYTAHTKKDKDGIDEDGILLLLKEETIVMHDHNIVNYNEDYKFRNAECCAHLIRDLQKIIANLKSEWAKEVITLLVETNNVKKEDFQKIDREKLNKEYDRLVEKGIERNKETNHLYYADEEATVLRRMVKYKENYLMYAFEEEVSFSNNVSERSLRGSKTKMKVSGQFQNLKHAEYHAIIKSYIETGKRHGLNPHILMSKALEGNYVSLEEMKKHKELVEASKMLS